jgi:hypothetical protein
LAILTRLKFLVVDDGDDSNAPPGGKGGDSLDVWTGNVERMFGAGYIGISREHIMFGQDLVEEGETML